MEKTKKPQLSNEDVENGDVNWPVVLPILLVMAAMILYVILF